MNDSSSTSLRNGARFSLQFLVVEDHEVQRNAACAMLRQLTDRDVRAAPDGRSALKLLADENSAVDVLFLDLGLPGVDGFEVLQALGRINSPVAVVLNSARHEDLLETAEVLAATYKLNVLGVIRKPLTPDKLRPLLQRLMRGQQDNSGTPGPRG